MFIQFSMSLCIIILLISIQQANGQIDYTVTTCSSPFEDISGSGNPLVLSVDAGAVVPIEFPFAFYCDIKVNVAVTSNGYLTFGSDETDFTNDVIPTEDEPNDLIAVLWDDLNPSVGDAEIYYITLGIAPNRYFIASWVDVPEWSNHGSNTFQAVLEEQNNCIEFRYQGTPTAIDDPTDVTIGIENRDGSVGVPIDANNLQSCYRICPPPSDIQCPEDITLECDNTMSGPSVPSFNFCGSDCSSQMSIIQGECCNTPSIQTTFTGTVCADVIECTQTVTIEDTTPPQITCPSNVNILLPRDDPIPSITGAATCSDNCDLEPSISFTDTGVQGCGNILSRKWICTDDCGNEDQCTQDITFSCTSSESEDDSDSIRGNSMGNGASSDSSDGFAVFNALFGNGDMDNDNMGVNNQNNMNREDEIDIQFGKSVYLNIGVMCGLCLIVSVICAIIYKAKNKNNVLSDEMETIV